MIALKSQLLYILPVAAFLFLTALCRYAWEGHTTVSSASFKEEYILVDAGHGGEDGGAQGYDGTLEKNINLTVASDLSALLRMLGYTVSTSRDSDVSLATEGNSVRARKVSDMQNRLAMYNEACFTVSIHQNYFHQSKYSGTQLFCANDPQSKALGECIRNAVVGILQPNNHRANKVASGDIFLLHNSKRPAVIVECGFLTNKQECDHLKTDEYQKQIAAVIAAGIVEYKMKEQ